MLWLVALACAPREPDAPSDRAPRSAPPTTRAAAAGDALTLLNRASLDLRGRHPSLEELRRVREDPRAVGPMVDRFVEDPAFPERMAWIWNERLHTALWGLSFDRFDPERGAPYPLATQAAMGWAAPAMLALLVAEGRPLTELVTAAEVAVHPDLPASWQTQGGSSAGWGWGRYADDRPMAGLLSSTTLWLRYTENQTNLNRGRANAVARILLCADFFDRAGSSFEFSVDFDAVEDAVQSEAVCTSCHAALDPLAAFFGGFSENSLNLLEADFVRYSAHTDRWERALTAPGYYGQPADDLPDLGALIASDPRYAACWVEHFEQALTRQPFVLNEERAARIAAFREGGLQLAALVQALVRTDAYRLAPRQGMAPELVASALSAWTGWAPEGGPEAGFGPLIWSIDHRVLGGGADDVEVTERNPAPTPALAVLGEWTGRAGAQAALEADLARAAPDRVLLPDPPPEAEAEVRALLAQWCSRAFGRWLEPDDAEVVGLAALWTAAGGAEDPLTAWSTALEALLRHPDSWVY